ncbi:MAG TPA: OmpA family protein [Caulobacteraceae bacterium]|nr:OmpA family protein [Caulobacteraceae bacterium]
MAETMTAVNLPARYPGDLQLGGFIDRDTMRFVRDYPHPPALVWGALTDPAQLGVWLWPCKSFEARLGGLGVFDPGRELQIRVTEFEPPHLLNLGGLFRFELAPQGAGCRLTVDLKRPPEGWSPMGLAGFHGWLGRLGRHLAGAPQDETEAWAGGIWNAVFHHCEWELRRFVSDGAKVIWRIHFPQNEAVLTAEAAAQLDELARLLLGKDLAVSIDGFGDDPCGEAESVRLCGARVRAASARLQAAGVPKGRINIAFVLGNYHYLVERDCEAGRAFNRRVELRPVY